MRFRLLILTLTIALAATHPAVAQSWKDKLQGVIGTIPGGGSAASGSVTGLSVEDISAGLREALKVGSERVVGRIGTVDGYNADPAIHIPLPPALAQVQSTLKRFGLSGLADDVELKLNRAAEAAAPKTKELIWNAITAMTLDDARRIYDGPDDAATQYFKRVATADLQNAVRPEVDRSLNEVGAVAAYDRLMGQYKTLPLVPDVKTDLTDHTVDLALQGLFHYLAREESEIRKNPAKRTTELLTRVFGR